MIYPRKLIAIICVAVIFTAQMPVSVLAASTDYIASQEANMISDLYRAIDKGDLRGVEQFSAQVKAMLGQSGIAADYKVNFDFTDNNGDTPLLRAAGKGRGNIVDYLLKQGANPNLVNKDGQTAVTLAARQGNYKVVKLLAAKNVAVPLDISQKMAEYEKNNISINSPAPPDNNLMWIGVGGGVALAAATAGLVLVGGGSSSASSGSSGGSSSGGSSLPAPLTVDCGVGSGLSPENCLAADFLTAEATAQEGFSAMRANYSMARGYDGRIFDRASNGDLLDDTADGFVKVAVIDSGVDLNHVELDSNLLSNLAVTCTTGSGCISGGQDTDGHGTNVAGIIAAERNGTTNGMQGIAPLAKIIPIKAILNNGSTTAAIAYATLNGAQVINNSYGRINPNNGNLIPIINTGQSGAEAPFTPAQLRAEMVAVENGKTDLGVMQAAVAAHNILVYAAGNDYLDEVGVYAGLPYYFRGNKDGDSDKPTGYDIVNPEKYDWSKNWVAVVALTDSNKATIYTGYCGVAKEWCLAAPGDINRTTKLNGGYKSNSGTSFAAPNVSGAIAVMLGAFPQLTPERALKIIFDTATDLTANPATGLYDASLIGVDDIYGHGLVNLQQATSPADGSWTLSVQGNSSSSYSSNRQPHSFALNESGLNLASAFGNALFGKGLSIMFLDRYDKDYSIPLEAIGGSLQKRESNATKLARFGEGAFSNRYDISENSHVSYTTAASENELEPGAGYMEKDSGIKPMNASYITTIGNVKENVSLNFNYKTSVADVFGFAGLSDSNEADLSATGVYKNPYLNFSHDAKSSIISYNKMGEGFTTGAYQGTQKDDNAYRFDESDTGIRGMFVQYGHKNDYGLVSLTGGVNIEDETLLGSEASGAFNIAGNSTTYYAAAGGRYNLSEHMSLIGNYNIGVTKAQTGGDSLFTSLGPIVSDSFSLGAEYTGMARNNDRLGFAVSQPLRVRNAQAGLSLPSDVDSDGSIIYQNHNISLAPTAREIDMETYYGLELSEKSKLAVSGVYALNPQNMEQNPNEGLVLLKYSQTLN